jgi:tetratricopeptide (TPR) repeat protein
MRNVAVESIEADPALHQSLQTLRGKEVIYENGQSTFADISEYIFRHAVFHDVTYESVLLKLRRVYHRQVAEGLIWLGDERVSEYAGRIGEHYELSGEPEQAARWYLRAGKQAQDTYAPEAAASYFQKALGFFQQASAQDSERELEAFNHLGEVLMWQARYTEAIENYKSMLHAALNQKDPLSEVHALIGIALALTQQGDHREAMQHSIRAEELARSIRAEEQIARCLWSQGATSFYLGDGQKALAKAEEALRINTRIDNRTEMARCLNLLAAAYYSLGDYRQAEQYWENALSLFQELGDRSKGMDVLNNLGVIADASGDYNTAFQRYHSALELAREMGYRDGEIVFLSNRGGMHVALGNYAAAEADLQQAIERAGKAGSWILPGTYYELCQAALHLGKRDEALSAARHALALSQQDGSPEYIGAAYRALGMVAKELGTPVAAQDGDGANADPCSGEDYFEQSLRVLEPESNARERARTLREWARYELRDGHTEQGSRMWKQAREIFNQLGAEMEVERMAQMPS